MRNMCNLCMCQSRDIGPDSLHCGKWGKFQSHAVTLTWMRQCPVSISFELFPYTTLCSSFKWNEPLFFELSGTQTHKRTHTQTGRHTDGHEYSIVVVDKLGQENQNDSTTQILKFS